MDNKEESKVEIFYNTYAHEYNSWYQSQYCLSYDILTFSLMKRFFKNDNNTVILDLGCGTGYSTPVLLKKSNIVYGIDISIGMLKCCKRDYNNDFKNKRLFLINCNADTLPFPDNTFDAVISQGDVLSYTYYPEKVLEEIYRVSKNNSKLILSVAGRYGKSVNLLFNFNILSALHLLNSGYRSWDGMKSSEKDFRIYYFKVKEMKSLLKEYNFKMIHIYGKPILPEKLFPEILFKNKKLLCSWKKPIIHLLSRFFISTLLSEHLEIHAICNK